MKRYALASLVLALSATSVAQAQVYDDRGYPPADGYYQDDDTYQDTGYADDGYAHDGGAYNDMARVLSVEPIVERGQQPVNRQECWNEPAPTYAYGDRYPQPRTSGGGAVIGAIVGGALGNTVGHGDDRQVATVLGAVVGGAIGNGVERQNIRRQDAYYGRNPQAGYATHDVRRCRTVSDYQPNEQVVGYRVNYEYGGRQYQTVTDYHPGDRMPVQVAVTPQR
jgi:uncharacterized protein YcfJ